VRDISYIQQTTESSNPLARFAHRERMALALKLVMEFCGPSGTVVDFGSGPGLFLHTLGHSRPDIRLIGHEPFMAGHYPEVRYVESLDLLAPGSVDVLTAFEVCEHLYEHEIVGLLSDVERVLKPGGALIISVPIMYGLAVVPKVLNWMVRSRKLKTEYTFAEIVKSAAGITVPRPENPRPTHKGFDFRDLRKTINERFPIDRVYHSPVALSPWWMSSQYFMTCRKSA